LFLLIVFALIVAASARSALATMDQSMLELGRHLMTLADSGLGSKSKTVLINNQQLGFRVFSTQASMGEVLNFYDSWCRDGDGEFAALDGDLEIRTQSLSQPPASRDRSWKDLGLRALDDQSGYLACIKHGVVNISSEQLAQRVLRFLKSGNVADLGVFHYAAVRRVGHATRVVVAWTQGDFFPATLFPEQGDAPGLDPRDFSRPPASRRMLSTGEAGHSENLVVYVDAKRSLDQLTVFYRRDFLRRNWRVLQDQRKSAEQHFFVVQQRAEVRVVSISLDKDGRCSVTVATST